MTRLTGSVRVPKASDSEAFGDDRLTRNWDELLQELRVTQTGVQLLTGFLATIPFSSRFESLDRLQVNSYLVVLCGSVLTTGLVIAPAAFHRVLFRKGRRAWLVEAADTCASAGLAMLALTISGVLFLAFDVTVGTVPAVIVFVVSVCCLTTLWAVVPRVSGDPGDTADDTAEG